MTSEPSTATTNTDLPEPALATTATFTSPVQSSATASESSFSWDAVRGTSCQPTIRFPSISDAAPKRVAPPIPSRTAARVPEASREKSTTSPGSAERSMAATSPCGDTLNSRCSPEEPRPSSHSLPCAKCTDPARVSPVSTWMGASPLGPIRTVAGDPATVAVKAPSKEMAVISADAPSLVRGMKLVSALSFPARPSCTPYRSADPAFESGW